LTRRARNALQEAEPAMIEASVIETSTIETTMGETSSSLPPLSIPRQAIIEGSITYAGRIVLEGTILGDVRCESLVVTERGAVDGVISAETATIMGEAAGAIYASHVALKAACAVTADIFHGKLSLEDGCYFEGKSRRVANPLTLLAPEGWGAHAPDRLAGEGRRE
jgi:cytoskeletal protein CcmA (bactofilin family)